MVVAMMILIEVRALEFFGRSTKSELFLRRGSSLGTSEIEVRGFLA